MPPDSATRWSSVSSLHTVVQQSQSPLSISQISNFIVQCWSTIELSPFSHPTPLNSQKQLRRIINSHQNPWHSSVLVKLHTTWKNIILRYLTVSYLVDEVELKDIITVDNGHVESLPNSVLLDQANSEDQKNGDRSYLGHWKHGPNSPRYNKRGMDNEEDIFDQSMGSS